MVYQEQVSHFGGHVDGTKIEFRPLEYDELKSLPLLNAVIRETLRLHNPIHSLFRKAIRDIPVPLSLSAPSRDGNAAYVVPKGDFLVSSPAVTGIDPRVWKNATVLLAIWQ